MASGFLGPTLGLFSLQDGAASDLTPLFGCQTQQWSCCHFSSFSMVRLRGPQPSYAIYILLLEYWAYSIVFGKSSSSFPSQPCSRYPSPVALPIFPVLACSCPPPFCPTSFSSLPWSVDLWLSAITQEAIPASLLSTRQHTPLTAALQWM